MPSRRLSAALGPLIALVLIGGVIAVVMGGADDTGTDFAQAPDEPAGSPTADPDAEAAPDAEPTDGTQPTPGAEPTDGAQATPDPTSSPAPESSPDSEAAPIASEQAVPPGAGPTPMPEPVAEPTNTPAPAVQDPTALTGGWVGGTPNTGTAVSAAGLLLLALGGGLLWLRRART